MARQAIAAALMWIALESGSLAAQEPARPLAEPVFVFFDWDKPAVGSDAAAALDTVAATYRQYPGARLVLSGHADRSGGAAHNRRSAQLRAEAVRAYLAERGVPAAAMSAASYGEERPLIPTADGVREPQNRRVEIRFAAVSPNDASLLEGDAAALAAAQGFALAGADGAVMGRVTLSEDAGGVTIKVAAAGLPAGVHGVHLHEKGLCEGPKFASAGKHLNPGGKQHGRDNVLGAHLGDLANFEVAAGGGGSTSFLVAGVMISGASALADADGTALVIHAKADDYKTDPSGDSGDRIACAVLAGVK